MCVHYTHSTLYKDDFVLLLCNTLENRRNWVIKPPDENEIIIWVVLGSKTVGFLLEN